MRRLGICFLVLGLFMAWVSPAVAHRVNIFAFVDGGEIQAECSFSRGNPVRDGKIEVLDAATNVVLLSGVTNAQGLFRFPVPPGTRDAGHDLLVRVNAGEGHQNEWRIPAADLGTSPGDAVDAVSTVRELQASYVPPSTQPGEQVVIVRSQDLEQLIDAALEKKLAPMRRMLAEQYNREPSLRDIIGGLGWLTGLAGIAFYFKGRRS